MKATENLKPVTYRIPPELDRRLGEVAQRTGRSKSYYIRRALDEWLEDREDYLAALTVLERVESGEERIYPLDEVERELGLAD